MSENLKMKKEVFNADESTVFWYCTIIIRINI